MRGKTFFPLCLVAAALLAGCATQGPVVRETSRGHGGTYFGELAPDRQYTLILHLDGSSSLTVEPGDKAAVVAWGRWSENAGSIIVQELDSDFRSVGKPIEWTRRGDRLLPKAWDRSLFGDTGLFLQKQ
jgi:hypothetical protein